MKFSHDLTYDATPERVQAMLADPAFREQVCDAMKADRRDVSVTGAGAGMSVVVDQSQPTTGVPAFAAAFVGDQVRLVRRERWTSADGGSLHLETPGKPGSLTGTISLTADGPRTVQTVEGDIKVKVPLIGGKLEGLVADLFRSAMKAEGRVGRDWLAGPR
ncbi:MAG: DUF2505 domain-containing protein [Nocardioidaceae bacterium]